MKAAQAMHQQLSGIVFPDLTVGLLHGKMPADDKESVMSRFKQGETQILVSTTVIEVGVDVPNATVMVIEQAGAVRPGAATSVAGSRRQRR